MTQTAQALQQFFGGFGIPAYVEYDVPDEARLPYITYQLATPDWDESTMIYARVWYRSPSLVEIAAKVDQISGAVQGGTTLKTESGIVMLNKGSPWAQLMPMEGDDTLKVFYLNFIIHNFTN